MADLTLTDISEKMRDIDFAVLSTRTSGGEIAARPMSNNRQVEYDGDNFFFTLQETGTVKDILRRSQRRLELSVQIRRAGHEAFLHHHRRQGRADPRQGHNSPHIGRTISTTGSGIASIRPAWC